MTESCKRISLWLLFLKTGVPQVTLSLHFCNLLSLRLDIYTSLSVVESDYGRIDTVLTFSPDNTSLSVSVDIQDDSLIESTETFALRLFLSSQDDNLLVFSPAITLISIFDNDRKCIFSYAGHTL